MDNTTANTSATASGSATTRTNRNTNTNELLSCFQSLHIPKSHATVGFANLIASQKQFKTLFVNRRLPDLGWSDVQIQSFLFLLSTLDTNNKSNGSGSGSSKSGKNERWCGVGEREGRVYSSLVANRHYGLAHGMGRSGDITEPQPKAVGSTILLQLTLLLVMDAIRRATGLDAKGPAKHGILLPLCTGMSMALVLASLRTTNTQSPPSCEPTKTVVLWSRIDQKSCFKAILTAGFQCIVVPTIQVGDQVMTDLQQMERLLEQHAGKVLAIITTTSCFAPRVPDQVDAVATLCATAHVAHIINHAYGLQCRATCQRINRACVVGRVDAIVCSTDKNFLVPVGGAIVLSPNQAVVTNIGSVYAGRASSAPMVDLFITLLSMGLSGYQELLMERTNAIKGFVSRLEQVATKYNERVLHCPANTISFGMTLDHLVRPPRDEEPEREYLQAIEEDLSSFGAMLFHRCVSGTRVVPRAQTKVMGHGQEFLGFGSSTDSFPHAYMTAACAIGVSQGETDEFFRRLEKCMKDYKTKHVHEANQKV